jgi:hypothetical protein
MERLASSSTVENAAARPRARKKVCRASASATSRLPEPSARAMAEETPPPIPLAAVCWINITKGKASDAPASTSVPRRPRNRPSNVIIPAIARRLRTFGAESRSSVGRTGPSSSNLVRAATGRAGAGAAATVLDNDAGEFGMVPSLIGAPPLTGLEQHLRRKRPQEPGGCVKGPTTLRVAKPDHIAPNRTGGQRIFLGKVIRNFDDSAANQIGGDTAQGLQNGLPASQRTSAREIPTSFSCSSSSERNSRLPCQRASQILAIRAQRDIMCRPVFSRELGRGVSRTDDRDIRMLPCLAGRLAQPGSHTDRTGSALSAKHLFSSLPQIFS